MALPTPVTTEDGTVRWLYADGQEAAVQPAVLYDLNGQPLLGNTEGTLLAGAARTATTHSPNQTNYNARGVTLFLNVTSAPGSPGSGSGLYAQLWLVDPVSGLASVATSFGASKQTTTGLYVYQYYPAGVTAGVGNSNGVLTRTWYVAVVHGNSDSYTYTLG